MPKSLDSQVSFSAGEWSPLLDARVDQDKYRMACRQLWNFVSLKQGGATRRQGTQLEGVSKYADAAGSATQHCVRNMKFQFSPTTSFMLEFGHRYVRFYSNGLQVQVNSAPSWVQAFLYPPGSYSFSGTTVSSTLLIVGNTYTIVSVGTTNWTLYGAVSNTAGISFVCTVASNAGSGTGVWSSIFYSPTGAFSLNPPYLVSGGLGTNWLYQTILEQPTPYCGLYYASGTPPNWVTATSYTLGDFILFSGVYYRCQISHTSGTFATDLANGDWVLASLPVSTASYPTIPWQTDVFDIVSAQINDVLTITHPFYPPYSLTRLSNTMWQSGYVDFLTPPLLDQNVTDTTITASAIQGNGISLTVNAPAWGSGTFYNIGNSVQFISAQNQLVTGAIYIIANSGSTNWTSIGASSSAVGTQFTYNGAAVTGAGGTASAIYNCEVANVAGAIDGTFTTDFKQGLWQQEQVFNVLHVGSTWQLAYERPSSYIELDGTIATGFASGTVINQGTSGGTWSSLPFNSPSIQCLGGWEVHSYGTWIADIAVQVSYDGGQVWNTVRTVSGRADRNVDMTGNASILGLYRIVLSVPSGVSTTPASPGATIPRVVFECVDSLLYGLVQITGFTNANTVTANVITQLANTGATEFWSEAAWSNYRGYPQAITTFQQRMIYASSGFQPQTIWGSVTDDYTNFALGDASQATDSFAFTLAANRRGPIQWLSAQTDLFCGFSGAEWIVNSGQLSAGGSATITPTAINAVEHSSWGSTPLLPGVIVGDACLYVQRQGRSIRQMLFSVYTNKYMSQDLAALSEHLFASGIVSMDYQPQLRNQGVLWVTTASGMLCGMTYEMEQEVFGWHRHTTGDQFAITTAGAFVIGAAYSIVSIGTTDFTQIGAASNTIGLYFTATGVGVGTGIANTVHDFGVESVAVIEGQGTNDDEVWVVVNRTLANGSTQRTMERLNPVNWEQFNSDGSANVSYAFYLDAGTQVVSPGSSVVVVNSLLNGRLLTAVINGNTSIPNLLCSGGVVTIPGYIPKTGDVVVVGVPYKYALQPMRLDVDPHVGTTQTITKNVSDVYLRLRNSLGGGIWDGNTAHPVVPINYLTELINQSTAVATPPPLYTGQKRIAPFSTYTDDPPYIVTGTDGLPLTVLALLIKYDLSGTP